MFKAYACIPGEQVVEIEKEAVEERLKDGKSHVWIDISAHIEEHKEFLKNVMGIHHLVVEDMSHPRMLPKVEEYDNYLFLILHDIILLSKEEEEHLKTYELFVLLGKNFLITARRHRIRAVDAYHEELAVLSHLFSRGTEGVWHGILRRMVDCFFPMLDRVEEKLDRLEEDIFDSPSRNELERIFAFRKDVLKLRSIAAQQLDVLNRLSMGEFGILSEHGLLLARDIYDHLYRVSEKAGSYREVTMGLLDAYLSQMNNKMNEIMKVLTVIATIMLPLSIVVGFYGMNFKSMPGLDHPYGWIFTLLGMGGIIALMLSYFKRKKWL